MKRFLFILLCAVIAFPAASYAKIGDMGFFGGISEGRRLPRTTEQLLVASGNAQNTPLSLVYKEPVFLGGGEPVVFEGNITVTQSGDVTGDVGSYTVGYLVAPSANAVAGDPSIERTTDFNVNYRVVNSQHILTYDVDKTSWDEVITVNGTTYTLDPDLSNYQTSIIMDRTPGVNYYRGEVSGNLVYVVTTEAAEGEDPAPAEIITVEQTGSFYGYDCAWSSTETHRLNVSVTADDWGMQYEVRPSVTVNKILQYAANEPTVISFEGNYKEVLQNFAGLKYDIFLKPPAAWDIPDYGTENLEVVNTFEQLPEPDLSFLKGNAAEDDIRKLFAMKILDGDPRYYKPEQAITRGQFMTALAKAIKLPIVDTGANVQAARANRPSVTVNLYSDVDSTRAEYPYIDAIQKAGIAFGRDNGMFYIDSPIERQEAFTVMVRALGLTRLGLNPTAVTPFTDSNDIESWAIREMNVANQLELIMPDDSGRIYPSRNITKGEAASLLNEFIEFMRSGLVSHFADQLVNTAS